MVCELETVNQRHRPGVDLTLSHGLGQCSGLEVIQGDTAAFHLEVEGLTTQVRNATHFHVTSPSCTHLRHGIRKTPQPAQTASGRLCRAIGTFPESLVATLPYRRGPTKVGESF